MKNSKLIDSYKDDLYKFRKLRQKEVGIIISKIAINTALTAVLMFMVLLITSDDIVTAWDKLTNEIPLLILLGFVLTTVLFMWKLAVYWHNEKNITHEKFMTSICKCIHLSHLLDIIAEDQGKHRPNFVSFYHDKIHKNISDKNDGGGGYILYHAPQEKYRDLLESAWENSLSFFDAVLTGLDHLPHTAFCSKEYDNRKFLKLINDKAKDHGINAYRIMIYNEAELKNSFGLLATNERSILKEFFIEGHSHTRLYWITKEELLKLLPESVASSFDDFINDDFGIFDEHLIIKQRQKYGKTSPKNYQDCVEILFSHHNEVYLKIFEILRQDIEHDCGLSKGKKRLHNIQSYYPGEVCENNGRFKDICWILNELVNYSEVFKSDKTTIEALERIMRRQRRLNQQKGANPYKRYSHSNYSHYEKTFV